MAVGTRIGTGVLMMGCMFMPVCYVAVIVVMVVVMIMRVLRIVGMMIKGCIPKGAQAGLTKQYPSHACNQEP